MDKLEQYLDQVCRGIGGPRSLRQHVRQELREHLLDAAADHRAAGLTEEEALTRALADFGGPDEVRSGLEATHGHRLLPVLIDKAMQWKEQTMRAKWLWTTWTYLAVVGIVVADILFFAFTQVLLVPKLRKIQSDGWLEGDAASLPIMSKLDAVLRALNWAADHATWLLLAAAGLGALFEWRVRSENKTFIRLSVLGTIGLVLTLAAAVIALAMVIPFELGMPAMVRMSQPFVLEQMETIDATVKSIEQALAKKDWEAIPEPVNRASQALNHLTPAAGAIPSSLPQAEQPTVDQIRARLRSANDALAEARHAAREKDTGRLEAALRKFHELYDPIGKAAARPGK
jgi:hypothetical protein